ncbi:MAG: hypothetical protein RLZZ272_70 [Actinomycetota bacterium]
MLRIVLALLGAVMALAAWLTSSPHGSSPDDGFHLSNIWCARGFVEGRCQFVGDGLETGEVFVPAPIARISCYAQDRGQDASCSDDIFSEALDELRQAPGSGNLSGERPGIYYRAMHPLVGDDAFASVWRIRIANALLAIVVSALVLRLTRPSVRQALIGSWLVTSVPLGLFLITSVNSGAWGLIGLTNLWAAALTALEPGPRSTRIQAGLLTIVTAVMAIGSRLEALPYAALSLVAVAVVAWRGDLRRLVVEHRRGTAIGAATTALGVALLTTWRGFDYLRATGEALSTGLTTWTERGVGNALFYNLMEFPTLVAGAFGWRWGLGWLDTELPGLVAFPAMAAFVALAFTGLGRSDRRKVVVVPAFVVAIVVYPMLVHAIRGLLIYEEYQPRQFIALLYLLCAFALLVPRGRPLVVLRRSQRIAISTSIIVANGIALHVNTRRYVSGLSREWLFDLNENVRWWWVGLPAPMTMWIVGTIGVGILVVLGIGAFRPVHEHDELGATPPA